MRAVSTPASAPLPIAVLASGEGSNLQALLDTVHGAEARVVAVAGDRQGARALQRAREAHVPACAFPLERFADRRARDVAMAAWVAGHGASLVVLAGYMAILTPGFLDPFRGRVINVHPSLLPAFPGLDAVGQALAAGVKVAGVTVHVVDDGVDTGPILRQAAVDVPPDADRAALLAALRPLEHRLLPEAVRDAARVAAAG